jgi:hypothetical protein
MLGSSIGCLAWICGVGGVRKLVSASLFSTFSVFGVPYLFSQSMIINRNVDQRSARKCTVAGMIIFRRIGTKILSLSLWLHISWKCSRQCKAIIFMSFLLICVKHSQLLSPLVFQKLSLNIFLVSFLYLYFSCVRKLWFIFVWNNFALRINLWMNLVGWVENLCIYVSFFSFCRVWPV